MVSQGLADNIDSNEVKNILLPSILSRVIETKLKQFFIW